jgi:N-carbamoyl-L-amino-acid hydrolase
MSMAELGKRGETGVDRAAFSAEDRAARRLLFSWAQTVGLEVWLDSIANLFLRYPGRDRSLAPILTGSHLDSQPTGGRFDGVFGVLASLEAVAALIEAGVRPLRSIEIVAWSNEEGSRFSPGGMGSQVFSGTKLLAEFLDVRDPHETPLHTALAQTLAELPEAPLRECERSPAAYLEAHIEQGPVLEHAQAPVGIVTGIQGCLWLEYEITGDAAHAGTTPQTLRRDAFEGALTLIPELRRRCLSRSPDCRFTVGRVLVHPNTPNTIPGRVAFTVDFRDSDPLVFADLQQQLRAARAAGPLGCAVRELFCHAPLVFPVAITQVVADAVRALRYSTLELVSGAFHDALFVSSRCPVGMIFARCRGGVSHNPAEFADAGDLTAAAQVLLLSLTVLAERPAA